MRGRSSRFLAVALCGFASINVARANCYPAKEFGQSGIVQYQYVLFPPGTPATSQSILGRFWQPGQYQGTNQGTCDDAQWLHPCAGDCPAVTASPAFWIYGTIGSNECYTPGCISGEMLLLLEERGSTGGLFGVARVDEGMSDFFFDFSRLQRNIGLTPIPKPRVTSSQRLGTVTRFGLRFDDPAPGFYGLTGVPATGTITAINLYYRVAATTNPLERTGWTFSARFPYVGGETNGTFDFAGNVCPGGGYHFAMAAALEFDNGQVVSDYVSAPAGVNCIPETSTGASRVPEEGTDALHVARDGSGALTLTWGPTCYPLGAAYSVYEGTIGDWTSHVPRTCSTTGTTAVLTPAAGSAYYLVVPYAVNDLPPVNCEGSYGLLGNGAERPASTAACAVQCVAECPGSP